MRACVRACVCARVCVFVCLQASKIDGAIAGYRTITGAAPLYGRWAYGFWQCKEHYKTQQEVLDAAAGYRNRSIPIDSVVQVGACVSP